MKIKFNYSRKELLELCEMSIVPEKNWMNRDSSSAQMQIGELERLLRSGCKFEIVKKDGVVETTAWTVWVNVYCRSFSSFENDSSDKFSKVFYLPTLLRIKHFDGMDWY